MTKQKILLSIFVTFIFFDITFLIYKTLSKKQNTPYTIIKTTIITEKMGRNYYSKEEHFHVDYLSNDVSTDIKYKSECQKNNNSDTCITYKYDYNKNNWIKIKTFNRDGK